MFPSIFAVRRSFRCVARLAMSVTLYFVSSTVAALAQNAPPSPTPGTSTPAQTAPSAPAQTAPSTAAQTAAAPTTPAPKPKPKVTRAPNPPVNAPSPSGTASTDGVGLPPITIRPLSVMTAPVSRPAPSASTQLVVVSPTTVPTPSETTASSVTVITASDIEAQQFRTVPDALAAAPGLNVVQTGGPGGQTSVFIRGTNSNHVKVLIDGVDASDPSNPNASFDFGQLLTGDIERIEILRGPQSGLYGSDAIGGVISITTKSGSGPPKLTLSTDGGSFGTFNQHAALSGSQGDFNYAFNVQHFQSTSTPVTPSYDLAPGEQRNNDYYDNWTYSTKLGAKLSDTVAVNLVGRYTDSNLHFTNDDFENFFPTSFAEPIQSTQKDHQFFGRGEVVWSPTAAFTNYFGVNYTNSRTWNFDPNANDNFLTSPVVTPPSVDLGTRVKYDYRGELQVAPGQKIVVGAEDQNETLRTNSSDVEDAFGNATFFETSAERRNDAGWLELQNQITQRFFIVSNIRYDANEDFGDHTTWRVAPVYIVPGTETKLKATYGTGFKAPSLEDLYVNFLPFFLANPNLKPEESKGWDVGFEQPLANDRIRFGSTYFRNDINNLITTVDSTTPGVSTLANVNTASTFGAENFAAWQVSKDLNLRADYTYTVAKADSVIACTSPPCSGQQLLRRPKNKASLTANWQATSRLSVSTTLLYVGSWWDIGRQAVPPDGFSPYIKQPGFTTVNLAVNYAWTDSMTVFGRIDNLFNKYYEDPAGFVRPGFGAFGGIRFTLGGGAPAGGASSGPGFTPSAPPSPTPRSAGVS
jgi:vitamin B12 transporter